MRKRSVLEAADAAAILAAAKAEAKKNGWNASIAVLDEAGHLLSIDRMDGAPVKSPDIAIEKARSAAYFRIPTKVFQDMSKDFPVITSLPYAMPLQGGVPIMAGNECVGAIGVSGMHPHEDEQVALAGVGALKA